MTLVLTGSSVLFFGGLTFKNRGQLGSRNISLRVHGMSWGCQVATCFKAPGVSLGGSGVSIGGVRILLDMYIYIYILHA